MNRAYSRGCLGSMTSSGSCRGLRRRAQVGEPSTVGVTSSPLTAAARTSASVSPQLYVPFSGSIRAHENSALTVSTPDRAMSRTWAGARSGRWATSAPATMPMKFLGTVRRAAEAVGTQTISDAASTASGRRRTTATVRAREGGARPRFPARSAWRGARLPDALRHLAGRRPVHGGVRRGGNGGAICSSPGEHDVPAEVAADLPLLSRAAALLPPRDRVAGPPRLRPRDLLLERLGARRHRPRGHHPRLLLLQPVPLRLERAGGHDRRPRAGHGGRALGPVLPVAALGLARGPARRSLRGHLGHHAPPDRALLRPARFRRAPARGHEPLPHRAPRRGGRPLPHPRRAHGPQARGRRRRGLQPPQAPPRRRRRRARDAPAPAPGRPHRPPRGPRRRPPRRRAPGAFPRPRG